MDASTAEIAYNLALVATPQPYPVIFLLPRILQCPEMCSAQLNSPTGWPFNEQNVYRSG